MSRQLRVVIGITSTSWGGNEKWAAEAASGLASRGHRVSVFYSHDAVGDELERRGLERDRVRLWGDLNPLGFASLITMLRRRRPDVLILTKQREYWMGGIAARRAGRPLVALRLGLRRRIREDDKRRRVFGPLSDLVIVNSTAIRDELALTPWFDTGKVRVLHNGVTTAPVDAARGERALREIGVPEGTRVVSGAGRLTNQKGFDHLIRAFARACERRDDVHLVILGEGGRRRELETLASATGLRSRIHLPGHRDDVREILSAVDVFALSSINEGMANALLEAMSVGAPIVATDVSGTAEAVRHEKEGLVVPPADETALAGAIGRLLDDAERAARLGKAAFARAESEFSMERMIDELERVLTEGVRGAAA